MILKGRVKNLDGKRLREPVISGQHGTNAVFNPTFSSPPKDLGVKVFLGPASRHNSRIQDNFSGFPSSRTITTYSIS